MRECPRCGTEPVGGDDGMVVHLVGDHDYTESRAKRFVMSYLACCDSAGPEHMPGCRTDRRSNTPPEVHPAPETPPAEIVEGEPDHTCPKCGEPIMCDWRGVDELEREAHRLKTLAGLWRAKLAGTHVGRPFVHIFDVEDARRLRLSGLSLAETASALGVSSRGAIHQALRRPSSAHRTSP